MRLPWQKYRTLNRIFIDESALKHNLSLYRKLLPGTSVCPVLKSNAYGHGLTLTAKILDREHCDFFCVDSLYEAYELQKARIKTPILILGYNFEENLHKGLPFHFTAHDLHSLEVLSKLKLPIHLKVNTGMNRMGFSWNEWPKILPYIKNLNPKIEGIYSHFASADDPKSPLTKLQITRFKKVLASLKKAGFKPKWVHIANSAGALKAKDPLFNMARIGIGLYEGTLEFRSTLIGIQSIKKGESVSYSETYTAKKNEVIGIIAAGYYEGIPRSLSNKGTVNINGISCPILGRVCMNHTLISLKGVNASVGDEVLVYSKNPADKNSVASQAAKAGTIPYELLVRLSESVKRQIQ
jgi:alanine racemase